MSRNRSIPTDPKQAARFLSATVGGFINDRLLDSDLRLRLKDHCAERLAASSSASSSPQYSDQAVLANLDWGIDALEDAISTSNPETKLARLRHAERMLLVCAHLEPGLSTAAVPNSYLSAWAHLYLSFLHTLLGAAAAALNHALQMFDADPFFARVDFAPDLWESLFLPHMGPVVGWYAEARHRIVMDTVPDAGDLSLTADFDEHFFSESVVMSVRPDQAEKLRELERAYGEALDQNTRVFARYYMEVAGGEVSPGRMPPLAEPPGSPVHEVSGRIPDFVKFGPILPKSAGFAPAASGGDAISTITSDIAKSSKESKKQNFLEALLEENEDENNTDGNSDQEPETITHNPVTTYNARPTFENISVKKTTSTRSKSRTASLDGNSPKDSPITSSKRIQSTSLDGYSPMTSPSTSGRKKCQFASIDSYSPSHSLDKSSRKKIQSASPDSYSPVDSPKTPPQVLSPKLSATLKQDSEQLLRLLSNRYTSPLFFTEGSQSTSEVSSPKSRKKYEALTHHLSGPSQPMAASPTLRTSASADSDYESELRKSPQNSFSSTNSPTFTNSNDNVLPDSFHTESDSTSVASPENEMPKTRPPKDFVCPITGQLFSDPVTLQTGQTFERRAIEEWLRRGNTTCPITRQRLPSTVLPQTNYVLKRLITSWMEANPELASEFSYSETPSASPSPTISASFHSPSPQARISATKSNRRSKRFARLAASSSPTSVISQAASETIINELKPYTSCLCTSENLQECETAVLAIAKIWKDSKANPGVHLYLSKQTILNGFMEILSASFDREVLTACIYVLLEVVLVDESVAETVASLDSDFDCLTALLVNGLAEAAVLMYYLRPTFSQLCRNNLVPSLTQVIMNKGEKMVDFQLAMDPKDAAIVILEQILSGGDENIRLANALSVISANGLPALVKCLNHTGGRLSIVSILLNCMRADKRCRNVIAKRAELLPVLELFHAGDDSTRSICIDFISEVVCLNRRTFRNQILQMIRDEGAFSTMHSLLVYLQMAPMEQQPAVASLLLQLDLLVEPRKMSIYREEAIDAIIEALKRKDFPVCQISALETLSSLSGRLSPSGKPLIEAWLLKIAGLDQLYNTLLKEDRTRIADVVPEEKMEEEEKAMNKWEKRVAFVLCNHDNGAIFHAFEECLKSNSVELAKSCLVIAAWLMHMLVSLPETGVKKVASRRLLGQFIEILQSSRNIEEKVLATLALKSFISDPDTLKELGAYSKCIYKALRKLKRCSLIVADTLKAIVNLPSVDPAEFWSCTELFEVDCTLNGEVLSLVHSKGRLFSSHSDGTIKMWDAGKRGLQLVQEAHDHSKAVTCLHVPSLGNKLYSGSLDKTIRVWTVGQEILNFQIHDMKETVQCLTTTDDDLMCFASQGTGVKLYNGGGGPRHVNFNKNVKCLAVADGNLYCGCTGYSIQEVDLSQYTSSTLYAGTRKLLGKQNIHALCAQDGILYAGGSSVDGTAGKAFSLSTKTAIGTFTTAIDIHCIALSSDFVFTGTRCGVIEAWLKERLTRVGSIKLRGGMNTRVTTLASDSDGEMLFSGSSDGKIQVWALD